MLFTTYPAMLWLVRKPSLPSFLAVELWLPKEWSKVQAEVEQLRHAPSPVVAADAGDPSLSGRSSE
jgi:hypothetical protein